MNWQRLFSPQRLTELSQTKETHNSGHRNEYLKDYDRIIFSSAFRRLQNKTQVFPLPGSVFVHNRLTHSLEVACVGRSLGKTVGEKIADKYKGEDKDFEEFYKYDLSNVIAAACLAHDIGNPPFGHSGEEAIRSYFEELKGEQKTIFTTQLNTNQQKDFEKFEGNSNALRVLTQFLDEASSPFNLTITTLAAIIKYPSDSSSGFNKNSGWISTKKSGFFDGEIELYKMIAKELGIIQYDVNVYARHPFVFLTEAADDICYRIIDIEDAHRLGIVSLDRVMDLFMPFFEKNTNYSIEKIYNKLNNFKDDNHKVQYLRAVWIGIMIENVASIFMDKEEELLNGSLQKSLLDLLPDEDRKRIKEIDLFSVEKIYNHKTVIEKEIAGHEVLGKLLTDFTNAIFYPDLSQSKRLLKLIPEQYGIYIKTRSLYVNIQSVVDYISGMTDVYALDLYKKIMGIELSKV